MTPEAITGWAMFIGIAIGWIVREYRQRRDSRNHLNNSITEDRARRFIAEHERDCRHVEEIKIELAGLRHGVNEGIRGVHERLDRFIEKRS